MEIIIVVTVLVIIAVWFVLQYNSLKKQSEEVEQAWHCIESAEQKRCSLLQKLQNIVKGAAKHEKETLVEVTKVRTGMSVKEMEQSSATMQQAYREINAIVEQYPELKANSNFMLFQKEVTALEEDLDVRRRSYNAIVADFNKKVVSIPTNIVASLIKEKKRDFFKTDSEERKDIEISF